MENQEIERKFLVKDNSFIEDSYDKKKIKQGYLNAHKERTVRIRIAENRSFITVKGKSNDEGTTRYEWEKEIPSKEAENLLLLCEPTVIIKTRYFVKIDNHCFEIDVFEKDNEGLIVAEIELNHPNESFFKPDWLGSEVTGETKYYNSQLSKNPFKNWS